MTTTDTAPRPPEASPVRRAPVRRLLLFFLIIAIAGMLIMKFSGALDPKPRIALITASQGPYWDMIIRGATDAARRNGATLDVINPPAAQQEQAIRNLVGKGYDGVAVSPNDPVLQAKALADVAAETNLITFDSDCPIAGRLVFIGTDNYDAGRMSGQQVREAIPDGGEVIIAIGSLDKQNGQQRRQGVIDELLERSFERDRPMDPVEGVLKGPKFTVVTTLVDGIDPAKAQSLAAEGLKKHPSVKCVVGLFAYSAPALLKALENAGKLGQVKVVGFDAYEETLAGIESGHVYGTILQDPYYMGYETCRILAESAHGNRQSIPLFQMRTIACDAVTATNVAAMRQTLARQSGGAPRAAASAGDAPTTNPAQASTAPAAG